MIGIKGDGLQQSKMGVMNSGREKLNPYLICPGTVIYKPGSGTRFKGIGIHIFTHVCVFVYLNVCFYACRCSIFYLQFGKGA